MEIANRSGVGEKSGLAAPPSAEALFEEHFKRLVLYSQELKEMFDKHLYMMTFYASTLLVEAPQPVAARSGLECDEPTPTPLADKLRSVEGMVTLLREFGDRHRRFVLEHNDGLLTIGGGMMAGSPLRRIYTDNLTDIGGRVEACNQEMSAILDTLHVAAK